MLEEDIRKKSKDLASMSLAVIAHNEVLDSILKEINEQHGNKAQSLDRIRRIVQSRLTSNNQQWEFFQSNFDRIHENFFRKLKDLYPDLTSTDMRLCALLRLNLSTKEIANMLNLTVRGVESARYRLRKKLGISEEARLTDFMINFK
jgi:DNA-binding CsgD family transcriptional regulator